VPLPPFHGQLLQLTVAVSAMSGVTVAVCSVLVGFMA
jgi:hypothetical protein